MRGATRVLSVRNLQLAMIGTIFGLVTVTDGSLLKYYTDIVGLRPTIYGKVFSIIGVIALFNNIWVGVLTDIRRRFIRTMRWTPPAAMVLASILLFIQPDWSDTLVYAVMFPVMLGYDILKILYLASANVFTLNILNSTEERTAVSVLKSYLAFIPGGISSYVPILLLTGDLPRPTIILAFLGLMLAGVILTELALKGMGDSMVMRNPDERAMTWRDFLETLKLTLKSRSAVILVLVIVILGSTTFIYYTGYLYYMDNVLNVSGLRAILPDAAGAGVQAAVFALLVILVRRFGSRDTLRLGLMVSIACYLGLTFVGGGYVPAAVFYTLAMTGFASFWALSQPLTGMLADMNELETGIRKTGTLSAFIALLTAPANSLMMLLFTTLLEKIGYDGSTAVQSAETVRGLKLTIGLIPAVSISLAVLLLSFLPLGKTKEVEISKAISHRRNDIMEEKGNRNDCE